MGLKGGSYPVTHSLFYSSNPLIKFKAISKFGIALFFPTTPTIKPLLIDYPQAKK
jgi:hypothetical protein